MTLLEQKIDAIANILLADNPQSRADALTQMQKLMDISPEEAKQKKVDNLIDSMLLDLGVPDHILGFGYLQTAITIAVDDPSIIPYITKGLYPMVADAHNTTASRAERVIRHAIEVGWDRCDFDMQTKYFGGKISPEKGKPTNSEFIARCANIIRKRLAGR